AVQLEENGYHALVIRFPHGKAADDKRLATLDLDEDLVLLLHAIEIHRRRQHAYRTVDIGRGCEIDEDLPIREPGSELEIAYLTADFLLQFPASGVEIGCCEQRAGTHGDRLLAFQH